MALNENLDTNGKNGKLRIVDRWGHTLCYFNGTTNSLEIKATARRGGQQSTKGEVYAINLERLLAAFKEAQLEPEPVFILIAKIIDIQMEESCKPQS
jgi:hypothetical protein